MDEHVLSKVCSSGKMDGFMFASDFLSIIRFLQLRFPDHVTEFFSFGETFEKRQMIAYELQNSSNSHPEYNFDNINQEENQIIESSSPDFLTETNLDQYLKNDPKDKSRILFTSLHHSREPLTLNMILFITVNLLHKLIWMNPLNMAMNDKGQSTTSKVFMFGKVLFVPLVNRDSYQFINDSYNKPFFKIAKMKRKNMNVDEYMCKKDDKIDQITQSGVDLNRNYDIAFDINTSGSVNDPCDETTRGKHAFSEPETQAMKYLVEHFEISAAMNLHAYGNLWITPYNYENRTNYFDMMSFKIATFYTLLSDKLHKNGYKFVGNATSTIKYTANGEASDWMLKSKGIIAMSPELGADDNHAQDFYIPEKAIKLSLNTDYPAIQEFLSHAEPLIEFIDGGWVAPILNDNEQDREGSDGYFIKFLDSVKKIFSHESIDSNEELIKRHLSFFIEKYSDTNKKKSSHLKNKPNKNNKKSDQDHENSQSNSKNQNKETKESPTASIDTQKNLNEQVQSSDNTLIKGNMPEQDSQISNEKTLPVNESVILDNNSESANLDKKLSISANSPVAEESKPINEHDELMELMNDKDIQEILSENKQKNKAISESINQPIPTRILTKKSQLDKDKQLLLKEYEYESIAISDIDELMKNTKAETMKKKFEQFLKNFKRNNLILIFENKSIIDLLQIDIILKLGDLGNLNEKLFETDVNIITARKEDDGDKVESKDLLCS